MRLSTLCPAALALAACLAAQIAAPALASPAVKAGVPAPVLSPPQQTDLALAQAGVAAAREHWWDPRRDWYDARLEDHERYPLATIWDSVPLFEALDAIAIAQPTAANRHAVASFAAGAERYLNRGLRPVPGYSPYPGDREANTETWVDDNGWLWLTIVDCLPCDRTAP